MKSNYFIIPALAVIFSCCVKEAEMPSVVHSDSLSAVISTDTETRTTMNGNQVLWEETDMISIFSTGDDQTYTNHQYTLQSGKNSSNATFTGTFENTKVAALYPYNSDNKYDGSTITLALAKEYQYTEGANNKAPMASLMSGEESNIVFRNAGALMALTVNNIPAGYCVATLKAADSDPDLAGSATITFNDGVPTLNAPTNGAKEVTITFVNTEVSNKTFYFPIPVANYSELQFSISDGKNTKVLKTKPLNAMRNKRYTSSITLDAVNATIPTQTTIDKASETLAESGNISIEDVPEDTQEPTITLPIEETDNTTVNIAFESISTETPITINALNDEKVAETVNITVPTESDKTKLNIDLPNSTVSITVAGASYAVIPEVTAATAENTLIIDKNVTISSLIIVKGNIEVKNGATVKEWSSKSGIEGTIYVEDGSKTPTEAPNGYEIKKKSNSTSLSDFLDNNTSGTYTLTQNEILYETNIEIPKGVTIDGGENKYSVEVKCEIAEGIGKGVFVLKGGSIKNITFKSPNTQYDIIVEAESTIEGCNFITPTAEEMEKGKRAIYTNSTSLSGSLDVKSCKFDDKVYAFNFSRPNNLNVKFENCDMFGWLSGHGVHHTFANCTFGESGGYQNYIPYCDANFKGCTFNENFTISLKHTTNLKFNECYIGEVEITEPTQLKWDFSGDGKDNGTSETVTIEDNLEDNLWSNSATTDETVEWNEVVAKIEEKGYYTSLSEALENVESDETIYVLKNINDATGLVIDTKLDPVCIDFGKHTYTLNKPGVGSTGTTTLGFQILEGQNIIFMNGTINCSEANRNCTWNSGDTEKGIAMMIQNYAQLTLENMTIDGTNIAHNGDNVRYVVSTNRGYTQFSGNTSVIAPEGDIAFDVCEFVKDNSPQVVWESTGNVTGEIELTGGSLSINKDLELTKPIMAVKNGNAIWAAGNITPSASWNGGDALVVVKRNASLGLSGSGSIDAGYNENIYAAVKMTEKGEESTEGTAELTVNDMTLKGYYYGITGNGNRHDTRICIQSGTIGHNCPNDGHAIYHPQDGYLEVWGGDLTGYNSAVELRAGKMNVNIGEGQEHIVPTFTSIYTPVSTEENGSGTSIKGAAIAVSQHSTHKPIKLQILGGVFNGYYALYEEYTYEDNGFVKDDSWFEIAGRVNNGVTISGTFNGKVYSENMGKFIGYGTFNDESAKDYVEDLAEITENNDGTWSVTSNHLYK